MTEPTKTEQPWEGAEQATRLGEPAFAELDAGARRPVLRARFNAGVTRSQQNDPAGALAEYAVVARLGEPVFAELDADGRRQVLTARVNAGVTRSQQNDPAGALAEWAVVARLGEPVFSELDADGRGLVLTASFNAGATRSQQNDPAGALAECAVVARLGEPVFAELDADGRGQVLTARFNAGATRSQQNDPAGVLAEWAVVARLGEPVFAELDADGRGQVLTARVNAGVTRSQQNDPAGELVEYAVVARLGEPVFAELDADGRGQVLRARFNAGVTRSQQNDAAGALAEYAVVARLGEPVFAELDANGRRPVLTARVNAGATRSQQNDPAGALAEWAVVARLGEPVFVELDADGRGQVLTARFNAGATRSQQNDPAGELAEYDVVACLGKPVFAELDAGGRGLVLTARFNAGVTRSGQSDHAGALAEWAVVAGLGEPVFAELDAEGRRQVLTARVNAGVTRSQQNDPAGELAEYAVVARLGEPVFSELDAGGRGQVLRARFNAGVTRSQQNDAAGALAEYAVVARLGEPVFAELDADERRPVLTARVNAGVTRSQQNDPAGALTEYAAVARLGEPVFAELDADGRRAVLAGRVNAGTSTRWRGPAGSQSLLRALCIAPMGTQLEASGPLTPTYEASRAACSRLGLPDAAQTARWWLSTLGGFPAREDHPRQRLLAHLLGIGLAHADLHSLRLSHRAWLGEALAGDAAAGLSKLSKPLARAAVAQALAGLKLDDLGGREDALVLARVRAALPSTKGWQADPPWRSDPAGLAQRVRVTDLFLVGKKRGAEDEEKKGENLTVRAPWYWLTQAGEPRLDFMRFGDSAKATSGPLTDALLAWNGGDAGAVVKLLDSAWALALEPARRIEALLLQWGVAESAAGPMALDAAIYGDWARALEDACADWIESLLQQPAADAGAALNGAIGAVLRHLPPPDPDERLLQRLHHFSALNLGLAQTVEERWRLLESGRFALASAVAEQVQPLPEDDKTAERLQAATVSEQTALAARLDRLNAGLPDVHPDPEREDITFAVFDALHEEMRRLKRLPQFPEPAACAAVLEPGEHLVQLRFGADGALCALVLSHATSLHEVALDDVPRQPAWQDLLGSWRDAAFSSVSWRAGGAGEPDAAADGAARQLLPRARAMAEWQAFVAADSPASRLLAGLRRLLGTSLLRCHLILPAELARLPWLARAVSGTDPARGDFEPGLFSLEASVSTWLQTRRAARKLPAGSKASLAQPMVVHSPAIDAGDILGDALAPFEALVVARRLGTSARVAGGVVEVAQALQAAGPAHLVMHGKFGPDKPGEPKMLDGLYLVNHGSEDKPDIETKAPAWLLAAMPVQGDISLASCEAMLADAAWGNAMGPVGIGPLLRASGAASVTAPLGESNQFASMIFYDLWYEARQHSPGLKALATAQQRLRAMSTREAMQRLALLPPVLLDQARQALLNTSDDPDRPFAHPALWGQFTMLGEAAMLPTPPEPVTKVEAERSGAGWMGRAIASLKAIFGAASK